jgi:predicted short-subunit dehydrogenase-like oxidoreductase (DUF2520 family)
MAIAPITTIQKMCNAQFPPRKFVDQAILPFRMKGTLSIIGAGRVGKTLGRRLRERGWRVSAVVTRSAATARAAVRAIGGGTALPASGSSGIRRHAPGSAARRASALGSDLIFDADVIFLTTADEDLPAIARMFAKIGGARCRRKIVLHTSATLDRVALAPFARFGAAVGSLHPMQAFGGSVMPNLKDVIFAVEGDAKASSMAQLIAKSLGGMPVVIDTRDKAIYHASAVIAAGSTYATIETGLQMLEHIGFTRRRAEQTLFPLLRQILDNIERIGPRAAWTGPLSRGDYAIVARHARALRKYPQEFRQAYAALAVLAGRVLAKNPKDAKEKIVAALRGR